MAYDLSDFQKEVIERSHEVPVLVDFWADWCGPCKMLAPVLEKLAGEAGGKWELIKINTEEHGELAGEHEVRGIPDVRLFKNGEVVDKFTGAMSEHEILKFLKKHLDSGSAEQLEKARQLLGEGETQAALEILDAIEMKDDEVWIAIAAARLETDPAGVKAAIDGIPLGSEFVDRGNALGELAELLQNVENWPEGEGREALESIRKRDWEPALDKLIRLVEKDRNFAGGGAVAGCKSIFQFLGMRHEISEKYHRLFSSALFS